MARKENMDDFEQGLGVFTINETSVGIGGNNRKRSDVQLIQFFLMHFYFEHPELFALLPRTSTGSGFVKIDGICGKQTQMCIWHYQNYVARDGFPTKVDGLVSVARAVGSPITGEIFTIHNINNWFRLHGSGKEFHGKLENHPNIIQFAPELRSELAAAQVGDKF